MFFIERSLWGSFASHGFEGVRLSGLFVRGVRACQGMLASDVDVKGGFGHPQLLRLIPICKYQALKPKPGHS